MTPETQSLRNTGPAQRPANALVLDCAVYGCRQPPLYVHSYRAHPAKAAGHYRLCTEHAAPARRLEVDAWLAEQGAVVIQVEDLGAASAVLEALDSPAIHQNTRLRSTFQLSA